MLLCVIHRSNGVACKVRFGVHVRNDNPERTSPLVWLKAVCDPGDDEAPSVTVMLPAED